LWRVPLPNTKPNTWNDENCADSFKAVAEFWDCDSFPLLAPIIGGLEAAEKEFTRWVGSQEYPRPIFWADGEEGEPSSPAKKLSEKRANQLAVDYFRREKEAGREPTQIGFERKISDEGTVGGRELLRGAYKKTARLHGVPVRRGRRPAQGT
jgi:hypothetical protein